MTKKDYELIAGVFSHFSAKYDLDSNENSLLWNVADVLAFELMNKNPRFDRTKFLQACGLE